MKADVGTAMRRVEQFVGATFVGVRERRYNDVNYDGTQCKSVAEFAVANNIGDLQAAAVVVMDGGYTRLLHFDAHRFVKSLHDKSKEFDDGIAIVLVPSPEDAEKLVIPDGTPVDQIHLTLGYFGNTDEQPEGAREALQRVAAGVATGSLSVTVDYGGIARFAGDPADALVRLADSPALIPMHNLMCNLIGVERDITRNTEHGFTPHTTIGYLEHDDGIPIDRVDKEAVTFTDLQLWYGTEKYRYTLGKFNEAKDVYGGAGPGGVPATANLSRRKRTQKRKRVIERARRCGDKMETKK